MSYNRRFTRRVYVPYSGSMTVNYPASENGGSKTVHYDGTVYEDVEVDIHVNTVPFDVSVADCNDDVNNLTASVTAMSTAQCVSIKQNTDKISKTIIDGFFHTVRTDLGTQKAELEQTVQARLMLLRGQADALRQKQQTMQQDYARTTARYQKIFEDLNKELSIRIHEVDQPVFNVVKAIDSQSDRMLHTDMVQTAVTMSKENNTLQAQISVANVKNHTLEAMDRAKQFLVSKAISERTLAEATLEGIDDEEEYLVPVCYMRTTSQQSSANQQCAMPAYYAQNKQVEAKLCDTLDEYEFEPQSELETEQVKSYIQSEIAQNISGDDSHSNRVRAMINKMINK